MKFEEAKTFVLDMLERDIPASLVYHNVAHTQDVYDAALTLATAEGVVEDDLKLLLTAVLFHDAGYIYGHENHEQRSCSIATEHLPEYGYTLQQIEKICGMIMATRIPQSPHNLPEEIICDADLDYLGREDFFTMGNKLFAELKARGAISTMEEWNRVQVRFLESHNYYTDTAIHTREPKKKTYLAKLKQDMVSAVKPLSRQAILPIVQDTVYIVLGVLISAFAMNGFMVPNHFLDGGVTGISLLGHEIYKWNLGMLLLVTNIPFILIGWFQINKTFAIKTALAIIGLAIALQYLVFPVITSDKLLVSIFGGFFIGLGIGLAMRGGCSIDGLEVLALFTLRKTGFTITEVILGMNVLIFLSAMFFFGIEIALYAMLTYFIAMRTIDYVVEGLEAYTGVTIISGKSEEIKQELVLKLGRGITIYKGERGFMRESFEVKHGCDIVFTIITRLEVRRMKGMIHKIDPNAFVFTHTIKEAAGGILKRKAGGHEHH